jgi:hypothetical protein
MSKSYYYLVSGLADLVLDEKKPLPDNAVFFSEVEDDLSREDMELVRLLRCPFDNYNLITLLENRDREFDERGNFTREELAQEIKNPSRLPEYTEEFFAAFREGKQLFPHVSWEDQLAWLFYDSVAEHPNPFIREWFAFDLNLRNVLAALSCREIAASEGTQQAELIEKAVICRNGVADLLRRSNAPDFSLSSIFKEIELILSFPRNNLTELEKSADQLRWRVLDEQVFLRAFKVDAVLAFVVKLNIARRWLKLMPAEGKQMLDELIGGLKAGLVIS